MKKNFSPTKEFVDQYLNDVVSHPLPFGDEEKNELTLEASSLSSPCKLFNQITCTNGSSA